jgi:hypothetical protein
MEEILSLNKPVQRLKVATLPLDVLYSGSVTHPGEISTNDKSHGKMPDWFSLNDDTDVQINMQPGILEGYERKKNNWTKF